MNASKMRIVFSSVALFALMGAQAYATPYLIVSHDGDNTPYSNWSIIEDDGGAPQGLIDAGAGQVTGPTGGSGVTVGGRPNALEISATTDDNGLYTDRIFTTADNLTGNYTAFGGGVALAGLRFDFYAGGDAGGGSEWAPTLLSVYFSTDNDSTIWAYDIENITQGWGTYSVSFGASGWYDYTGTSVPFNNALTTVDSIGLAIMYTFDQSGQIYGIDNFGLTVPEPETYMILGMALLSVAVVFRKRITESLVEARAMMQA